MKRPPIRPILLLAAILIATVLVADMVLDSVVMRSVGKVGGQVMGTELTLDGAGLFLFAGAGSIKNLQVANPVGYTQPSAFQFGTVNIGLRPESVFQDMLQISRIQVLSPQINFEGTLDTNNLATILKNVEAMLANATNSGALPSPGRRMQVEDIWITGARLNIAASSLGNPAQVLTLPDIHLTDLGTGTNGICSAELAQLVLSRLNQEAVEALAWSIATTESKPTHEPVIRSEQPPRVPNEAPAQP